MYTNLDQLLNYGLQPPEAKLSRHAYDLTQATEVCSIGQGSSPAWFQALFDIWATAARA
jgi:hypothetical protein